ncbi:MAG: EpsG family protein [Candidatus Acidiferrum sp.]
MTGVPVQVPPGWQFLREKKWIILVISIAVIVPCLWHRHIEAGDLASHVYNAWLAQMIEKGQAPGLYFVRQWDNVLVDWMLLQAANLFGLVAAEKIVTALCVLIFFWGVFAFIAAASGQPPWFVAPCIAMLAYGYSFNMGFLNYYLSLGLAALCLALLWRGRGWERTLGLGIVPLVFLAHPLGLIWILGTVLYVTLWKKLPNWWKLAVPAAALGAMLALHGYLAHQTRFPVDWPQDPFYLRNGADQLILYGHRYATLAWAALIFGMLCVLFDVVILRRDTSFWRSLRLPAELYFVALGTMALLPENLRPSITGAWIGLLASRLTTIVAIFGLCVMGCLKPRKWHLAGFAACALVFFAFLYKDTLVLNRMESEAQRLVSTLPFGTRVISTIWAPLGSRVPFISHVVDRACIAHCFSYANYEPASGQFCIRARSGSPVASASEDDSEEMQSGEYEVQDEDLPMMEIYQCDEEDLSKLCIRELAAGEKNGRLGFEPNPD